MAALRLCIALIFSSAVLEAEVFSPASSQTLGDTISIDVGVTTTTVTITKSDSNAIGLGFGGTTMSNGGANGGTYAVFVETAGVREGTTTVSPSRGIATLTGQNNWQQTTSGSSIVLTRANTISGCTACYTFDAGAASLAIIYAKASSGTFDSYHASRVGRTLVKVTAQPTTVSPTTASPTIAEPTAATGAPSAAPSYPPGVTAEPSASPSTTTTTAAPTSPTAAPSTTTASSTYETCVTATDVVSGVDVMIKRHSTAETVQIVMTGPADLWFGVGFGALSMSGTYAITVQDANSTVAERTLGAHQAGSELTTGSIVGTPVVSTVGTERTVTITRPYASTGAFDFTALMECDVSSLKLIAAKGSSNSFGYHASKSTASVNNACSCTPAGSDANNVLKPLYIFVIVCVSFYFIA